MSTALIVDSNCDLPESIINRYEIVVIPTEVTISGNKFLDYRKPIQSNLLYSGNQLDKKNVARSQASEESIIENVLEESVLGKYETAIIQTMSRKRSLFFERAGAVMARLNNKTSTSIRVQDTKSVFAGQGVIAAHSAALIKQGVQGAELRRRIDNITNQLHTFAVPQDIFYLRERAAQRGEKSVSIAKALVGKALGMVPILRTYRDNIEPLKNVRGWGNAVEQLFVNAARAFESGLASPIVCISYAGKPEEIDFLPGFTKLSQAAEANGAKILKSQMSIGGGVNMGPGTVSIAFAAENFEFKS